MIIDGVGIPRIQKEIEKCVSRCANCHMKRTAKTLGYWKAARQFGAA